MKDGLHSIGQIEEHKAERDGKQHDRNVLRGVASLLLGRGPLQMDKTKPRLVALYAVPLSHVRLVVLEQLVANARRTLFCLAAFCNTF